MKGATGVVTIIGGGLAGSEAAFYAAKNGLKTVVYEMKPEKFSPAHTLSTLGELVCSNSLKSEGRENASGLLKEEMRLLGSIILEAADATRVPAGNSLAVDRGAFSSFITGRLEEMGVEIIRQDVSELPGDRPLVIATGPLTTGGLAARLQALIGKKNLFFYDAVSPVVYGDSIDMDRAFFGSRYNKGGDDYINCPLNEDEYGVFVKELLGARAVLPHDFESTPLFEGCMPIEAMAGRGPKTLMFGPLRPVGLIDPRTGKRPFAVVQLRMENSAGTLYNMVGFQTKLAFSEQARVFRMIPALENAEFARYGKLHRNTYMDSPGVISRTLQLRKERGLFFAGQITGVEGYCESAVAGIVAGMNAVRFCRGREPVAPPPSTMTGALLEHISTSTGGAFQPMNANFGLLPQGEKKPGGRRKRRLDQADSALEAMKAWQNEILENLPLI
ncbi:MAG: methylenetetrahydrofolate--tRNA-(uracil(54)-C(5))-methyltransferase (FADH(2)-oxidizing) TrmFO [Thermodesulfobacteriota bacterium]|nr:MAG: methylenetetrahydrofolate--tRNA-(uracil(54)-C(5))-methyltransferase (FADH(2)-oxidizing) TrmFO [Thermodesulfobacteriota bacterium]